MIAGVIGASNEAIHTIEEAKKQGVKVIAFDGNPDAEGLRAADKAVVVDITNEEATIEAVRQEKVDFLLTAPIGRYLTTTGAVNDALNLPGITKRMAQVCTDKYLFHQTLKASGLRNINCYATDADVINAEIICADRIGADTADVKSIDSQRANTQRATTQSANTQIVNSQSATTQSANTESSVADRFDTESGAQNKIAIYDRIIDNNDIEACKAENEALAKSIISGERKLQYPAILKPRYGSGSRGIHIVSTNQDLLYALREVAGESYVIEECLEGEEYGVDAAVIDGQTTIVLLRHKKNTPLPNRQAVAYHSVKQSEKVYTIIEDYVRKAVACAGLDECLLHADVLMTKTGPFMIEMSARPSGHNLHNLFTPLCTGVDMAAEYVKHRLGRPFSFVPNDIKTMMIHYFDYTGVVVKVPSHAKLGVLLWKCGGHAMWTKSQIKLIDWKCKLRFGDTLHAITDGHSIMDRGYYILEGDNEQQLEDCARSIRGLFF